MKDKLIQKLEELTGKKVELAEGLKRTHYDVKLDLALEILPKDVQKELSDLVNSPNPVNETLGTIHEYLNDYDRHNQLALSFSGLEYISKRLFQRWRNNPVGNEAPLTESEGGQGLYTTAEMEHFIKSLINAIDKTQKIYVTVPSNWPSSSVARNSATLLEAWNFAKQYYGPDALWNVWSADVGGSVNKPKQFAPQRIDMKSILDIVTKYPEAFRGMSMSVQNENTRKWSNQISTQGD